MGKRIFFVACFLVSFAAVSVASPASSTKKAAAGKRSDTLTYVGCLQSEGHGQQLVLTKVAGKDAPRARSWKTAFMTKRPVDVEVIGVRGVKLREYVGHTVRVTGRRAGHQLHAESVTAVTNSCF